MSTLETVCAGIKPLDDENQDQLRKRLDSLTKPQGSLGRMEELALRVGRIQDSSSPQALRKLVVVMAADHGVCSEGVSAFPSAVTAQMVRNFCDGGAAINFLARHAGARVLIVDMGVATKISGDGYLYRKIANGTQNFLRGPAMSAEQAREAVEAGIAIARDAALEGLDLIAGGDMGIGNTTSSSVITCLITGKTPAEVVGRGTGVDDAMLQRKRQVIADAVALHSQWQDGLDLLRRVGGFEIAGLTGLILGAAQYRVPIVLDGFVVTAAALVASQICPAVTSYLIAAHRSAEPGHAFALQHLHLEPLLDWNMRLGEGTGAALVFPLIEASCKMLSEMATFESAQVSGKLP
jgi:nicotinate-nucleotide--dimethylbenzimidazole phosphoribosyltransferase